MIIYQWVWLCKALEVCLIADHNTIAFDGHAIWLESLERAAEIFGCHPQNGGEATFFEIEVKDRLAACMLLFA